MSRTYELKPTQYSETMPGSSDAMAYLRLLAASKRGIFVAALVSLGLATIYLLITPRVYEADALLKVDYESGLLESVLDDTKPGYVDLAFANEEVQVLRSRAIIGDVVDSLDLTVTVKPVYFPLLGRAVQRIKALPMPVRNYLERKGYATGADETLVITSMEVADPLLGEEFEIVAGEAGTFSLKKGDEVLVEQAKEGDLVSASATAPNDLSILVSELNAAPGRRFTVVKESRQSALDSVSKALDVETADVKSRVVGLSIRGPEPERLAEILNGIIANYQNLRQSWSTSKAKTRRVYLEEQVPVVRKELDEAERALAEYRRENNSIDLAAESQVLLKQESELRADLTKLEEKRAGLRQRYTDRHPLVVEVDKQRAVVQSTLERLGQRASNLPGVEQQLLTLQRNVKINSDLLVSLLANSQKMRIAEESTKGSVRIIDAAEAPEKPVHPRARLVLPLALLAGVLLYLVLRILRNTLGSRIESSEQLERIFGLPVFADIPHSKLQQRYSAGRLTVAKGDLGQSLLALNHPEDFTVESLRSLRTILSHIVADSGNNVICVCGPRPKMGKSFVSSNLAALLARSGYNVLLVDADLRRGTLHRQFGVDRRPGMTEMALGLIKPDRIVKETSVPNLHLLTRGGARNNPAEVLSGERTSVMVRALAQRYDYVLIDAPPILDVADAAIIGRLAGSNLMVVKPGLVSKKEVELSLRKLLMSGVKVDGCLINDLDPKKYQYASYGYGYNYAADESD